MGTVNLSVSLNRVDDGTSSGDDGDHASILTYGRGLFAVCDVGPTANHLPMATQRLLIAGDFVAHGSLG